MQWTGPKALRQQVQRLWDRGILLSSLIEDENVFPRRLVFKTPDSKALSEQFDEVRQWIHSLQKVTGIRIEYRIVRHQVLGENRVPVSAWLDSLSDAIRIIGRQGEVEQFSALNSLTGERTPGLLPWLQRHPLKALALANAWPKLLDFIDWLTANPRPAIYLRQVDIAGIDSKFLEQHRAVLSALLDLVLPREHIDDQHKGVGGFLQRYGFLSKPLLVRFRLLDPAFTLLPGSDGDISLTDRDFAELNRHPGFTANIRKVYITENEINFLAFPRRAHSLVIFGAGYGFESLANIPWLEQVQVHYWGDIDTHGFIILHQLRNRLPHARSLLMDEATLLAHKSSWGREPRPERRELPHLTGPERRLYDDLCSNRFAPELRLEQERIGFEYLSSRIA